LVRQATAAIFIYEGYEHLTYPEAHPFRPERAAIMMDILQREGVLEEPWIELVQAVPASREDMERFHDAAYLDAIERIGKGRFIQTIEMIQWGIGGDDCPAFKGVFDLARLSAGSSIAGAKMLAEGKSDVAFNPIGGFHHAGAANAEGFCYINDVVLACMELAGRGLKVANVDLDAHHGNGTESAFLRNDRVLTISTHESGKHLYPFTGFEKNMGEGPGYGYNVNIPLPPGTDDVAFERAFDSIVMPILQKYDPDIIVLEIGMDILAGDPLTHLRMTNNAIADVAEKIRNLGKPVLLLGSGGYKPQDAARGWALVLLVLCDAEPEDTFTGLVGGVLLGDENRSGGLRDMRVLTTGTERKSIAADIERIIEFHRKYTFPIHGIE